MRVLLTSITLLFIGCATHAPMSEMVVLTSKQRAIKGYGFASSGTILNESGELPESNSDNAVTYKPTLGLNYFRNFFIYDSVSTKGAISLSFGKATGIDATVQILGPVYISAAASFPENLMISMPLRVVEKEWGGLFISPVVRQQSIHFEKEESFNIYRGIFPDGYKNFGLIGVKSGFTFYSFTMASSKSYMMLTLEAGKFIDFEDTYFSIGIILGEFSR